MVKKVTWLIDTSLGLVSDEFIEVCKKRCNFYDISAHKFGDYYDARKLPGISGPVVCIASIPNLNRIIRARPELTPGKYMDLELLKCEYYMPAMSEVLLNRNYFFLPLYAIPQQIDIIRQSFAILDNEIFIRPNRCSKPFAGQVIDTDNIKDEIKLLKDTYHLRDNELCVLSSNKKDIIDAEYRFVVVNGKVVAGSQYLPEERTIKYRHSAFAFAQKCATLYEPDLAFTLDICQLKNSDYKLLELNSFSAAGLYKCDPTDVIKAVDKQAREDWNELYKGT